jgi:hypothetical protein
MGGCPGNLILRLCGFWGPDPNLEPISCDEWFKEFDEKQLASIYEEKNGRW